MHKLIFANMLLFISGCLMHAQTLDEVVSKHLDAMGGAKRLRAVQTMSMERVDAGDLQKGNSITTYRKRGDKFRLETIDITPVVKMRLVQGCDGKNSWTVSGHAVGGATSEAAFADDPPTIRPADESCKSIADINGPLLDYKTKEGSLTLAGIQKVGEADAYDVRLNSATGQHFATHFYIEKKSFLLVKVAREANGTHTEDLYTDYRKVDGMMVPFLWETRWWTVRKDLVLEEKAASEKIDGPEGSKKEIVKSVKFNTPLPDYLFAPPSPTTPEKKSLPAAKK
jgi:hypothetical protein